MGVSEQLREDSKRMFTGVSRSQAPGCVLGTLCQAVSLLRCSLSVQASTAAHMSHVRSRM